MGIVVVEHAERRAQGILDCLEWLGHRDFLTVRTYAQDVFPDVSDVERVILSGGPGHAADLVKAAEYQPVLSFIRRCIELDKPVLGICLGHQILALMFGGEVETGARRCGWSTVKLLARHGRASTLWGDLGDSEVPMFHFNHDEVTSLPTGAKLIATSGCCRVEGYFIPPKVWAIQSHPEVSPDFGDTILRNNAISPEQCLGDAPDEHPYASLAIFDNFCRRA